MDMCETAGRTAANVWRRLVKRECRNVIEQKKLSGFEAFQKSGASEEEIFVEMRFDREKEESFESLVGQEAVNGPETVEEFRIPTLFVAEKFRLAIAKETQAEKRLREDGVKEMEEEGHGWSIYDS